MRHFAKLLLPLMLISCSIHVMAQTDFYYYNGKKMPLTLNENKVVISIPKDSVETSDSIRANVRVLLTIKDDYFDIIVISRPYFDKLSSLDFWEEYSKSVIITSCYFRDENNVEGYSTPYLQVELKKEGDMDLLKSYAEKYKLRIIGSASQYFPLWIILSLTLESEISAVQCANELYESGDFAHTHPDLCSVYYDPIEYPMEEVNVVLVDTVRIEGIRYELRDDGERLTCSVLNSRDSVSNDSWSPYYMGRTKYSDYKGDIVIPESVTYNGLEYQVTSISDYAFVDCYDMKSIVLPDAITFIGASAFSGCMSLNELRLPEQLRYIGDYALRNCCRLHGIVIPQGLDSIPDGVFYNCVNIEEIRFPEGVRYIGAGVFEHCTRLESIHFPGTLEMIGNFNLLYFQLDCPNLSNVYIEASVPPVQKKKRGIYMEDEHPEERFKRWWPCVLHVPAGTKYLYSESDGWNYFKSTVEFDLSSGPDYGYSLSDDVKYANPFYDFNSRKFDNLHEIDGITYSILSEDDRTCCVAVNRYILHGNVTIPGTVMIDGSDYTVVSVSSSGLLPALRLEGITLPNTLKSIDADAFLAAYKLESIRIPESVEGLEIGLDGCSSLKELIICSRKVEIRSVGVESCPVLEDIYLLNASDPAQVSLPEIKDKRMKRKITVHVPEDYLPAYESVAKLSDSYLLVGIPSDDPAVLVEEGRVWHTVTLIPSDAPAQGDEQGYYKDLNGNWCKGIPHEYRLEGDTIIDDLTYKKLVDENGDFLCGLYEAFSNTHTSFGAYTFNDLFFNYRTGDRVWYERYMSNVAKVARVDTILVQGVPRKRFIIQDLAEKVVDIWIEGIGSLSGPFCSYWWWEGEPQPLLLDCTQDGVLLFSLEDLYTDDGYSYDSLNGPVVHHDSVSSNGYTADLVSDTIYYTVQPGGAMVAAREVNREKFRDNFGFDGPLTPRDPIAGGQQPRTPMRVHTMNSLGTGADTVLVDYAPYSGNLVIPESVSANDTTYRVVGTDYYAFIGCTELETVSFPESVTTLGYGSFAGCIGLKGVNIPSGVVSVPDAMFYGCTSLDGVVLPDGIVTIGHSAFYNCSGLTEIVIPASVELIDEYAFYGCTGLKRIVIEGNPEIAPTAFLGCGTGLEIIKTGIESIDVDHHEVYGPVHYGIDGRPVAPDAPGLHIIRMPDGRMRKALILSK